MTKDDRNAKELLKYMRDKNMGFGEIQRAIRLVQDKLDDLKRVKL